MKNLISSLLGIGLSANSFNRQRKKHRASGGEILSFPEGGTPQDVSKLSGRAMNAWRSQCGMIFQDFCLVPRLDVLTNVLLGRLSQTSTLKSLFKVFPWKTYHSTFQRGGIYIINPC